MTETVVKAKKVRKKNPLELHRAGECGCSVITNPNNCIYQPFLDGWEFTPDVGNGQKRGEVFTPRFIVDKMIKDIGMIPEAAVYGLDHATLDKEEALHIIEAKVLEPAVGTGNYISTILWHKLQYAYNAALSEDSVLDVDEYHKNILKAVSSVYVFDIDAGNLSATRQRLFNSTLPLEEIFENKDNTEDNTNLSHNSLNNDLNVTKWATYLLNNTETKQSFETLKNIVKETLDLAETNWAPFLASNPSGVIGKLYKEHTGEETVDHEISYQINRILNRNVKLFNGIVKEDTDSETFVCPGWKNVVWDWWKVEEIEFDSTVNKNTATFDLLSKKVRLADQMLSGEIESLEAKAKRLKDSKMTETDEGLFSAMTWEDKASETEYNKLVKQVAKLKKELDNGSNVS